MILNSSKIQKQNQEFKEIIAFLVFFYAAPILLLAYNVIPREANHVILVGMSLIMVAYSISKPIASRELGLRRDNLKQALIWQGALTAVFVAALIIVSRFRVIEPKYYGESALFYLYYIFLSAPLQEFVFRSLMFRELNIYFKKDWAKVLIAAVIFSLGHYAYRDISVLLLTLVAGLFWGWIYLKKPNFWAVAVSHAIVGAVTVFLGYV
jgi:hypothetical protein